MKSKAINFLYAIDCYLLYILSGVIAALGVVVFYSISAASNVGGFGAEIDMDTFSEYISQAVSGKASVVLLVSYCLVLVSLFLVFKIKRKRLSSYTGMSYSRPLSIAGAILFGALFNVLVSSVVPREAGTGAEVTWILILCIALGPFVEEIMFRGILLKMFGASCGLFLSVIITSILFAISHGSIVQGAYTFVLGVALAVVRIKSTSLWSSLALHISFNITGAVLAFLSVSFDSTTLIYLAALALASFIVACTGGRVGKKGRIKSI